MSLKCGIVGLPNVGKSTLFNALTRAGIAAENYPFCTIEPNVGIVEVPDPRLAPLAAIAKPEKRAARRSSSSSTSRDSSPARRKGEGLGNQFLANIRETDAIAHRRALLRGRQRRARRRQGRTRSRDIETINTELALADLARRRQAARRSTRRRRAPAATRRRSGSSRRC